MNSNIFTIIYTLDWRACNLRCLEEGHGWQCQGEEDTCQERIHCLGSVCEQVLSLPLRSSLYNLFESVDEPKRQENWTIPVILQNLPQVTLYDRTFEGTTRSEQTNRMQSRSRIPSKEGTWITLYVHVSLLYPRYICFFINFTIKITTFSDFYRIWRAILQARIP